MEQVRDDRIRIRAVFLAGDAPFYPGGPTAASATYSAVKVKYVANMACHTVLTNAEARPLSRELHDKHFLRKHGCTAYYGQVEEQ